jgi:UDP-N-acetylglucosamine 4,6-dehydratase
MARDFTDSIRFVLGDIRDIEALRGILRPNDVVIHAAAIKHIDISEMHPEEAIKTNVLGAMNLVQVAKEKQVRNLIAVSSDKACNPNSTYGTTKLLAERIFVQANEASTVRFSNVRFGNLIGSSGSVFHRWKSQREQGANVTVTDLAMTRFFMSADAASLFILGLLDIMQGGEVFVPKIHSFRISEIAEYMTKQSPVEIGLRLGEKLHEELISASELANTVSLKDYWIIQPSHPRWPYAPLSGEGVSRSISSESFIRLDSEQQVNSRFSLSPKEFCTFLTNF